MNKILITSIQEFDALVSTGILGVYSGVNGKCCCGCAGRHVYASDKVELAGQRRGYAVTPDEVSDRSIKIILGKMRKAVADGLEVEYSTTFTRMLSAEVGNRLYLAYMQ